MDFQHSDRVKSLQKRLNAFMDEYVYPAEAVFEAQMDAARESGNRWQPAPVIEELKEKKESATETEVKVSGKEKKIGRIRSKIEKHQKKIAELEQKLAGVLQKEKEEVKQPEEQ